MTDLVAVDANVLLRFLQGEPVEQAAAAERLLRQAEQGELRIFLHPVVFAEIVYVATSSYGLALDRVRAVADLRTVLQLPGLEIPERGRVLDALRRFETTTLDWADCVLLSYLPDRTVYTFDRQMIQQGAQQPRDES